MGGWESKGGFGFRGIGLGVEDRVRILFLV